MQHLLNDTVLDEYLSSPRRDRAIMNHVRQCPECQASAREARLFRLLLHEPLAAAADDHIDPQTLADFSEEQLNDYQTTRVTDHLANCEHCLLEYRELHRVLAPSQARPVPKTLKAAAMAAFTPKQSPRPKRWGRLVFERVRAGFELYVDQYHREVKALKEVADSAPEDSALMGFMPPTDFLSMPRNRRMEEYPPIPGSPVTLNLGVVELSFTDVFRDQAHTLLVLVDSAESAPGTSYQLVVVTPLGEEPHSAIAGEEIGISLPADAQALRFQGDVFAEPIELELEFPLK